MAKKKYPPLIPVPHRPENKYISKKEFVAWRKGLKEKQRKINEFAESLDQEEFKEAEEEVALLQKEITDLEKKARKDEMEASSTKQEKSAQQLFNKVKSLKTSLKRKEKNLADKKKAKDKK